ncbi:unnamed protein product [Rotaria sp. Silwood2]|nr:unnamed protein product [Rotaria sp. Silwood2]
MMKLNPHVKLNFKLNVKQLQLIEIELYQHRINNSRQPGEISHYYIISLYDFQAPSYATFGLRTRIIANKAPPFHDGSMTLHAHGGASTWDSTYATTS